VDLLVYCDYLEENKHGQTAHKLRRWAEEMSNPATPYTSAQRPRGDKKPAARAAR
jgi:hypothetical protein